jgi:hypothetical protein
VFNKATPPFRIMSLLSQSKKTVKVQLQEFVTRLLVRFKRVKKAPVEIEDINQLINSWLPENFDIDTPGGISELSILSVKLTIAPASSESSNHSLSDDVKECIHAELFCNFSVNVNRSIVFNTHLKLFLQAVPIYYPSIKSIGIVEPKVIKLDLIADKNSFIKDSSTLANALLPSPLKDLFNVTLTTTKSIFGVDVMNAATKYLSLYNSGNQQRVIDYHRADIENKIIEITSDKEMSYKMDDDDFEEKLFADFGKEIIIENGRLYFVFS